MKGELISVTETECVYRMADKSECSSPREVVFRMEHGNAAPFHAGPNVQKLSKWPLPPDEWDFSEADLAKGTRKIRS